MRHTSPAVQNQPMLIWTDETSELPPGDEACLWVTHLYVKKIHYVWFDWSMCPGEWHLSSLLLPGLPNSRDTPSPIDPNSIHVPVKYEPDPADLALSSIPGQEMFDPRKCKFSAEELKPQPMIKKARKVFIPEDLKVNSWTRELELEAGSGQMSVYMVFKIKAQKSFDYIKHLQWSFSSLKTKLKILAVSH